MLITFEELLGQITVNIEMVRIITSALVSSALNCRVQGRSSILS